MGLIMGVDLCDDYSQVSWFDKRIMDAVQLNNPPFLTYYSTIVSLILFPYLRVPLF